MTNLTKAIAALGVVAGLGVAALPLTSYAETTPVVWDKTAGSNDNGSWGGAGTAAGPMWVAKPVGVQLVIEQGIQIAVTNEDGSDNAPETVDLAYDDSTKIYQGAPIQVNVVANNKQGYHLSIAGTHTVDGHKSDLVNEAGTAIIAGTLNDATTSSWGYKAGESTTWAKVTDADVVINSKATPTGAAGENTKVVFGAQISDTQEAGTYTGQVTFTATAGPATNPEP